MEPTSIDRWRQACNALGVIDCDPEYWKLVQAWRSWGRHYHTIQHLAACLGEFDGARGACERPAEVELALWFHDAIYRTFRQDNEARSAAWAARFLGNNGATAEAVSRVRELVLATRHGAARLVGDAALVVDIDLSILGQPKDTYDAFERNVRREYWWVPKRRYATARCRILQSFLSRSSIYHWPQFRERYEAAARKNLEEAIATLSSY